MTSCWLRWNHQLPSTLKYLLSLCQNPVHQLLWNACVWLGPSAAQGPSFLQCLDVPVLSDLVCHHHILGSARDQSQGLRCARQALYHLNYEGDITCRGLKGSGIIRRCELAWSCWREYINVEVGFYLSYMLKPYPVSQFLFCSLWIKDVEFSASSPLPCLLAHHHVPPGRQWNDPLNCKPPN